MQFAAGHQFVQLGQGYMDQLQRFRLIAIAAGGLQVLGQYHLTAVAQAAGGPGSAHPVRSGARRTGGIFTQLSLCRLQVAFADFGAALGQAEHMTFHAHRVFAHQ